MIEITLGAFATDITAAVAEDLAARLLGDDGPNFEDRDFQQLLPLYGEAVLNGLNWELPGELADAVREVARTGGNGPPLYQRLPDERAWNSTIECRRFSVPAFNRTGRSAQ